MQAASMPGAGQEPQVCNRHCGCADFMQKDIPDRRAGLSFCRPILGIRQLLGVGHGNYAGLEKIPCTRSCRSGTSSKGASIPSVQGWSL